MTKISEIEDLKSNKNRLTLEKADLDTTLETENFLRKKKSLNKYRIKLIINQILHPPQKKKQKPNPKHSRKKVLEAKENSTTEMRH